MDLSDARAKTSPRGGRSGSDVVLAVGEDAPHKLPRSPSRGALNIVYGVIVALGVAVAVLFALYGVVDGTASRNKDRIEEVTSIASRNNDRIEEATAVHISRSHIPPTNYVLGGSLNAGAGQWTRKPPLPAARSDMEVVYLETLRKIVLLGGYATGNTPVNSVVTFDPVFEQYSEAEIPDMQTARARFGSVSVNDTIYAIGGWGTGTGLTPLASVERYDVDLGNWTFVANMSINRGDIAATVIDGKIYVFGGYSTDYDMSVSGSLVEVYDPDTDTWSKAENMPTGRGDLGVAVYGKCAYAVGGWSMDVKHHETGDPGAFTPAVERFCPGSSPAWTKFPDLPLARGDKSVVVFRGQLFAIGGEVFSGTHGSWGPVNLIPVHDVHTLLLDHKAAAEIPLSSDSALDAEDKGGLDGVWTPYAPHPEPRFRASAITHGDHIFTFGGHAEGERTTSEVYAYYDTKHPLLWAHYRA